MSLALYRTYRPGRFADVVGQEHVTVPLSRALQNGRMHHAYLFSGPRGCGKTSSARILARSLNCEKGPTPEPCGTCESCIALAPNGPGSLDVMEIDAATHGLVDDARELRERAHFAPANSRYKVYIIDEAHQLGPGAANALLKIIEEPPAHLIFVFATTSPDKLLGTIRSRTHHYPFRLVPSRTLVSLMGRICEAEHVVAEPAALTLAARAGAGSARDSLSVLGQLIAGSAAEGVTAQLAQQLLGFTDAALLDDVVDALAVRDAATVFGAIDRVTESGHDPRRFLTDLLERLRDLLLIRHVPDATAKGLVEVPDDEATRLQAQAGRFGDHDLLRLATVADEGITAMKGATPSRLQLELTCARMLLPAADDSVSGVQARLDVIERRLGSGAAIAASEPAPARHKANQQPTRAPAAVSPAPAMAEANDSDPAEATKPAQVVPSSPSMEGMPSTAEAQPHTTPAETEERAQPQDVKPAPVAADAAPGAARPTSAPAALPATGAAALTVADVRRQWDDVLARLFTLRRSAWTFVSQNARVLTLEDGVLTLAATTAGLRTQLERADFSSYLKQALLDVFAADLTIRAVVDPTAGSDPSPPPVASSPGNTRIQAEASWDAPPNELPAPPAEPPSDLDSEPPADLPEPPATGRRLVQPRPHRGSSKPGGNQLSKPTGAAPETAADGDSGEPHPDDPVLEAESHTDLLARELGAVVIDEFPT